MSKDVQLMKGNEALAETAIRIGVDGYFGYPITPQSEIIEYLMAEKPYERTGMVVLQAESEIASINMLLGAGGAGKKALTSSSGPGISLMQEGLSYIAGSEVPCVVVNVQRGGPGLGTIQPSQADYFQAVKGGGHGDYKMLVLAPASVQEMSDFLPLAFDLAFKYRNPVMILADGVVGQMMEKVELRAQQSRTNIDYPWATTGKPASRKQNIITSVNTDAEVQEAFNLKLIAKYERMTVEETRYEKLDCDDAEYLFVAFGISARLCQKAITMARSKGIKVGVLRPITLFPFPTKAIQDMLTQVKGILTVEMNAGQMVEDVRLAVNGKVPVELFGRLGGIIAKPNEILEALETKLINKK